MLGVCARQQAPAWFCSGWPIGQTLMGFAGLAMSAPRGTLPWVRGPCARHLWSCRLRDWSSRARVLTVLAGKNPTFTSSALGWRNLPPLNLKKNLKKIALWTSRRQLWMTVGKSSENSPWRCRQGQASSLRLGHSWAGGLHPPDRLGCAPWRACARQAPRWFVFKKPGRRYHTKVACQHPFPGFCTLSMAWEMGLADG